MRAEFRATPAPIAQSIGAQPLLILAALIAVYIVLGVLYESLAHPLTIISTLPSAGLGALLALQMFRHRAVADRLHRHHPADRHREEERHHAWSTSRSRPSATAGSTPEQAIYEACLERFRPILMTTLAALLGALPLVFATGPGSELRRPLGITIVGGLLVSQMLTLYTTPVIYLMLDRLHRRLWGARGTRARARRTCASVAAAGAASRRARLPPRSASPCFTTISS